MKEETLAKILNENIECYSAGCSDTLADGLLIKMFVEETCKDIIASTEQSVEITDEMIIEWVKNERLPSNTEWDHGFRYGFRQGMKALRDKMKSKDTITTKDYHSPIIDQILSEITPKEEARVEREMRSMLTTHDLNEIDNANVCRKCGHQNSENCNTCTVLSNE